MVVKFLRMQSEKDIIPTASERLFSMHLLEMMLTCWFYRVVTQTLSGRFKRWPMPVEDRTPPDAFHIIIDWCIIQDTSNTTGRGCGASVLPSPQAE
jgi:hypothetical protein